jgi:prevent-host-death family protein
MAVVVLEADAAERLDELVDRAVDGEDVVVISADGRAVRLVPLDDAESEADVLNR